MPSTYTLISSNVLGSSAASVTFSAIPSTYTDLVLRLSTRTTNATAWQNFPYIDFGSSQTQSTTMLAGNGSANKSRRTTSTTGYLLNYDDLEGSDSAGNTASTFDSIEIYIPNYLSTVTKPMSSFGVAENNTTKGFIQATALLSARTTAISTIRCFSDGQTFAVGSSFYLYGLKSS
jgi:hypothetical protein